ncbi:MAG: HU family DNA-binding protein [Clostridia bacterium]|nr:HU family DNA-binding protein [Clostridia bacterium]
MNKTDLVAAIAAKADLTKKDAEKALAAAIEAITKAVKKGDKVQLVGFGTFEARKRAARQGINPATGAKIKIAASKTPVFKAGKAFKDAIK